MWYYLRANANAGLNYRSNAMQDAEMAVTLEPNNMRYRSFYQRLKNGAETYRNTAETYGRSSVVGGDICLNLCLLSLCCPCNGPC
jgi:molecular chaperone DnaJ